MTGTPDHVLRNRAAWDHMAADYAEWAGDSWAAEPSWGIWSVPDEQAGLLPPDLSGSDALELGCGTGYVSAWLARLGARPAQDLIEIQPAPGATTRHPIASIEWARQWPCEEVWKARKIPARTGEQG